MAIEIKELVVKATVNDTSQAGKQDQAVINEALISACAEEVLRIIKKSKLR